MKTRATLSSAATLIVIVLFSGMLQTANGQKYLPLNQDKYILMQQVRWSKLQQ